MFEVDYYIVGKYVSLSILTLFFLSYLLSIYFMIKDWRACVNVLKLRTISLCGTVLGGTMTISLEPLRTYACIYDCNSVRMDILDIWYPGIILGIGMILGTIFGTIVYSVFYKIHRLILKSLSKNSMDSI